MIKLYLYVLATQIYVFSFPRHHLQNMQIQIIRNMKKDMYQDKCALESILSGALWPADRVHSVAPAVSDLCPRCGEGSETSYHTFFCGMYSYAF